ncbi:MAG: lipid-A-disaccharide synthase, partial [Alphaproteobacteria bacterium]
MSVADRPLRLFFVAGEHSGDQLGGKLIAALSQQTGGRIVCAGVGGEAMAREGCPSLFPLSEVAVMGPLAIARRLPALIRRVHQTVEAGLDFQPDALVILDSPEFTHPIARRVKRKLPHLPVIDYVSPSIWAWRPGRARWMRRYIDHVLAILPFEPGEHERLGGPPCTY